jgi:archaemetzincin
MKFYVGELGELESAFDREALAVICNGMARFGAPVERLRLPAIDFAYDAERRQYASIEILRQVDRWCPSDAWKVLAVTPCDLFLPVLTFVFGQAQMGGRVGLVSLARLKQEFYGLEPDREILLERAAKEALHETGHLFSLAHCGDISCAMALSTSVRQIDSKRAGFCAACAGRLARQRHEGL